MRIARGYPVINLVAVNVGWFACVLGAAAGRPALGPVVVAALVLGHLLLGPRRRGEIVLIALAAGLGYAADSALVLAGIIDFPGPARLGGPSPLWMVALWVNLSTSLHAGLAPLQRRPILAGLVGAVAGPLAYLAGVRFGAISLPGVTWQASAVIALEWAVALPLLLGAARWVAGAPFTSTPPAPRAEEVRA